MSAKVAKLTRYPKKGEPGLSALEMSLVAGHGVAGDPYKGGERQVSLLSSKARNWIEAQTVSGLCFKRFRENILIDGLPDGLPCGALLIVGEAVLRVVAGKECFDECKLHSSGADCSLSKSAVFAEVVQDGAIKIGDDVKITPAPKKGDE